MLTVVVVVVDVVDVFSDVVAADVAIVYCYCSCLSVKTYIRVVPR